MSQNKVCIKCLYTSSHPLGIEFNEDGICTGCIIHEEKDKIDWQSRWQDLEQLVQSYKCKKNINYDCIVPVTGGQDSYYIMHLVKEKLGLNPLIVTYNKYYNTRLGIRNLANLRTQFNTDILIQNVNPHSVKKIIKTTLRELGSIYWQCIAGQTVFPVQTAVRYKIPLIIWGAHQGLEQVGMFSHMHNVEMTRRYRKNHDLMGFEADDLLSVFDTLSEDDIWQYRYPVGEDINNVGVRGIYLGNYVRWDPKNQHEEMIKLYNYRTASFGRTFDCYDYVDCYNYMNLHDHIKYIKTGISKVTDHACREIRHGRMNKQVGSKMVKYYQNKPVHFIENFLQWLGINEVSLKFTLNTHRNKKHWVEKTPGIWDTVNERESSDKMILNHPKLPTNHRYICNDSMNGEYPAEYITIGKGHP